VSKLKKSSNGATGSSYLLTVALTVTTCSLHWLLFNSLTAYLSSMRDVWHKLAGLYYEQETWPQARVAIEEAWQVAQGFASESLASPGTVAAGRNCPGVRRFGNTAPRQATAKYHLIYCSAKFHVTPPVSELAGALSRSPGVGSVQ
jgi:hypothetical protein